MKTLKNIFIFIGLYLIQQVPLILMEQKPSKTQGTIIFLSMIIVTVIMLYFYNKINKLYRAQITKNTIIIIFIGIIMTILINIVSIPFMKNTGNANVDALQKIISTYPELMVIYSFIVGPILEELLFRGFFINLFFPDSKYFGLVTSSILFGIVHVSNDSIYLTSKILLGLVLGAVYLKTKNIKANIFIHMINNISSIYY
ncbi:CPBP family intramembrane glutamic endopeptidase [Companilactobacillus sp. DQM5]|uniref:CPBP family intramembrane glutamic endopeptidase n=1 Tax=Companilactobacillus sp. DQM5 TaxID=3463359 RepID=UPI0040595643